MPDTPARSASDRALERVLAKVHELGLEGNLIELETQGFTRLPAVLSETTVGRARDAILARVERTTGRKIDITRETGEGIAGTHYVPYLIYDDPVFEEILLEPAPLALVTYLLGESCLLSSMGCHIKTPGGTALPFTPTTATACRRPSRRSPRWRTSTMR
jgi:hypothetical protein